MLMVLRNIYLHCFEATFFRINNSFSTKKRKTPITEIFLMGWVSYLHRTATTCYLCCDQALEDLQGAGRIGLTHIMIFAYLQTHMLPFSVCKVNDKIINSKKKMIFFILKSQIVSHVQINHKKILSLHYVRYELK